MAEDHWQMTTQTNCCWTEGDEFVVTTGGHDCTLRVELYQWAGSNGASDKKPSRRQTFDQRNRSSICPTKIYLY